MGAVTDKLNIIYRDMLLRSIDRRQKGDAGSWIDRTLRNVGLWLVALSQRKDAAQRLQLKRQNVSALDRAIQLQFDLEPLFLALMDHAIAAGWTEREIAMAITDLADNYMLGVEANGMTEVQLDFIKRSAE